MTMKRSFSPRSVGGWRLALHVDPPVSYKRNLLRIQPRSRPLTCRPFPWKPVSHSTLMRRSVLLSLTRRAYSLYLLSGAPLRTRWTVRGSLGSHEVVTIWSQVRSIWYKSHSADYNFFTPLCSVIFLTCASPLAPPT